MCGYNTLENLQVHHITDRRVMPNGGYVIENGIALCSICHIRAETEYSVGMSFPEYTRDNLYKVIESNYEKAVEASKKLK